MYGSLRQGRIPILGQSSGTKNILNSLILLWRMWAASMECWSLCQRFSIPC